MSKYTMLKPIPQCGEGIYSVVEIPDDVVKQIRSDAIDEFASTFIERIKYDEVVQYTDSSEYVSVSVGSVICLVKKLAEELKENADE